MSRRPYLLALTAALATFGCGSRPRASGPAPSLEVAYSVEAKPRTHFELLVPARGFARIAAHRTLSAEPHGPAGFFGAPLPKDLRAEIERRVETGRLFDRHDEPDLSERRSVRLRVERGNRRGEISPSASDDDAAKLRDLLDGLVSQAGQRPVAALRLQAKARFDGPNVKVRSRLSHIGQQPIQIGVTDPHDPLQLRIVLERDGRLVDEQRLDAEDLSRLVAKRQLPSGWHEVTTRAPWTLIPFQVRAPSDRQGLFARVEARLLVRTKGRDAIVIELTSPSVSVEYEEEASE